jgi:hypothetical protein
MSYCPSDLLIPEHPGGRLGGGHKKTHHDEGVRQKRIRASLFDVLNYS